ncbi:hypothetical protein OEZ85_001321 [Tetradesmus obliquus]|uniref:RING-CH-type domain-containing protein n=1 Tax=Tetradesmus obliquus TaxID=3088 RepID=A0ABY8UN28_TETOB|nr:hypothetical protein OEZ85_001321 [Tetradesmus obliquus]
MGSSAAAAGSSSIGTCRICFEQDGIDKPEDAANPLITPCQCTGSSKYVHRLCLKQWREKKHRSDAFFQCEVCQYRYRYRRLWWSHLLGHQNTLTALFMAGLSKAQQLVENVQLDGKGGKEVSKAATAAKA